MAESGGVAVVAAEVDAEGSEPDSAVGEEPGQKAWAALKADKNDPCDPCETYVGLLAPSVEERLVKLLQGEPAVGGINLTGTLQQQKPLTIDATGTLQTTKEHWRWENCRKSLETKGLYEAPDLFSGFPSYRQGGMGKFAQLQVSRME